MSLFYTIIPPDELFEDWDEYEPALVEIQAGQAVLLVAVDRGPGGMSGAGGEGALGSETGAGSRGGAGLLATGVIERVISADPSLYLVPELAPGSTVHFRVGTDGRGVLMG